MMRPASSREGSCLSISRFCCLILYVVLVAPLVNSFQSISKLYPQCMQAEPGLGSQHPLPSDNFHRRYRCCSSKTASTSLNMFMGSDGGVLGIGTPELFTILLVGYFVLGPSDLYALVKEVGKFVQNVRTLGTEATTAFENTMESQIELKEIRRAQQELNDAFSFRRSINVDGDADAFSNTAAGPQEDVTGTGIPESAVPPSVAATESVTGAAKKQKKKRKRVKKKQPTSEAASLEYEAGRTVPDLDMSDATSENAKESDWFSDGNVSGSDFPSAAEMAAQDRDWLAATSETSSEESESKSPPFDAAATSAEQSRFKQQLGGSWNQKILENEDKLAPLAMIMEKLALLEEEKTAADRRLEDEFLKRSQQEEEFYKKKRKILEEAAAEVQKDAYVTMDDSKSKAKSA